MEEKGQQSKSEKKICGLVFRDLTHVRTFGFGVFYQLNISKVVMYNRVKIKVSTVFVNLDVRKYVQTDMVYECIKYIEYGRSEHVVVTGIFSVSICSSLNVTELLYLNLRSLGDHVTYVFLSSVSVLISVEQPEGVFESHDITYPLSSVTTLAAMSSCSFSLDLITFGSVWSMTILGEAKPYNMEDTIVCRDSLLMIGFFFEPFFEPFFVDCIQLFFESRQTYPGEYLYKADILLKLFLLFSLEDSTTNLEGGFLSNIIGLGSTQSNMMISMTLDLYWNNNLQLFKTYLRNLIGTDRWLPSTPSGEVESKLTLLLRVDDGLLVAFHGNHPGGPIADLEGNRLIVIPSDFSHLCVTQVIVGFDDFVNIVFRLTELCALTVRAGQYGLWAGHWDAKSKVTPGSRRRCDGTGAPAWHGMVKPLLFAKSAPKAFMTSEVCKPAPERKLKDDDVYLKLDSFRIISQCMNLWLLIFSEHIYTI